MMDCAESGTDSELPGASEPTLANRLAASLYLAEIGITGSLEDIAYQVTIQLAEARHANKQMHDIMSSEVERYRSRWLLERELATDHINEVERLLEEATLRQAETDYSVSALLTAQDRLDNALAMYDDIAPYINWNEMTK